MRLSRKINGKHERHFSTRNTFNTFTQSRGETMNVSFTINGSQQSVEVDDPNTPLLWVIRDMLNLKGTKFGCGKAACGACTILIEGDAVRCCSYAVKFAEGKTITTIEGLGTEENPHPVQQAWIEEIVPQCGYCQPGQVMSAAAFLATTPQPTDEDIDAEITNICRCGTYENILQAALSLVKGGQNG